MLPHRARVSIPAMKLRFTPKRWAAWAFAFALLLKAAMPLLATGSAHAQGKALVEVCTVYGVATLALDAGGSQPGHDGAPSHAADHCVLSGLVAFAGSDSLATVLPQAGGEPVRRVSARADVAADACAAWLARLEHAPPVFA
jgi:hypothetical protein